MIGYTTSGSFDKTEAWLRKIMKHDFYSVLDAGGQAGVKALAAATPQDSGLAASSWGYKIVEGPGSVSIIWTNSDVENGFHVALQVQLGHGTGTGGYVAGRDYINPAMKPIFDKIESDVMKAVNS